MARLNRYARWRDRPTLQHFAPGQLNRDLSRIITGRRPNPQSRKYLSIESPGRGLGLKSRFNGSPRGHRLPGLPAARTSTCATRFCHRRRDTDRCTQPCHDFCSTWEVGRSPLAAPRVRGEKTRAGGWVWVGVRERWSVNAGGGSGPAGAVDNQPAAVVAAAAAAGRTPSGAP